MNGIHDLGGMDGFGPVEVEANEPVFHAAWERLVFGLVATRPRAAAGNTDAFRHAIERMEPAQYLRAPYYERWLTALATLLVERGVVTRAELDARAGGPFPLARAARGEPPLPILVAAPRFAVGDHVRVHVEAPRGHTRCPRYVRGRRGTVVRVDPSFPLPDVAAHRDAAPTEPTYGIRFEARELWGADAGAREAVHVDLWEHYLEAAS